MFGDLSLVFDFRFNIFALFSLVTVIVNLVLFDLIQRKGAHNSANRWFSLVLLTLIWWGLTEFLDRSSANQTASLFWDYIGRVSWISLPVVLFSFVLYFTGRESFFIFAKQNFI